MLDIVDAKTRSHMMSKIKSTGTRPEMIVRRYLHGCGYRYALHKKDLPGSPDLVLSKYKLVVFVHGCFWHRHNGCFYTSQPATRVDFWVKKFEVNVARDAKNISELKRLGWRVLIVWECGLKHSLERVFELHSIILGDQDFVEWPNRPVRILTAN